MLFKRDTKEEPMDNNTHDTKPTILQILSDNLIIMFNIIIKTICFLFNTLKIYMLWVSLHYAASQLYIELCVPKTVFGFLASPFITSTPQCQSLRWVIYNGANMISNMWLVLGTWITTTLLIVNKNQAASINSF